jgi:ACS family hexuronate transporter-like MFS transporter
MAHALTRGVWSLGALRFLLGAGESGNFMAAFKAVSEWYPAKERALVNGLINGGAAIGAVIAPPVVTWIAGTHGWRAAFVITGSLGFLWLAFWLFVYYSPERHPFVTTAEREYVLSDPPVAPDAAKVRWTELLRYPQTWGLLLARFLSDPVWWFYLFWLPKYLVEQRGFTVIEMGMMAWAPYLTADLGSLFGGWISGFLISRGYSTLQARMMCMLPFACLMPLSLLVHRAPHTIALTLICIVTFAHMAWKTNQMTLTNDIFPKPLIGTVSGMLAFGNGLGGTLFTWMTGPIVQWFGYEAIFAVMSVLHPLSYLIVRGMARQPLKV